MLQASDDGKRAYSAIEVAPAGGYALWKGVWGKPLLEGSDDGKRASSAIGVEFQAARPMEGGFGGKPLGGTLGGTLDDGKRWDRMALRREFCF